MFYFRNRGKAVKTGRLFNDHNQQCLDNRVKGVSCDANQLNQHWTLYENGELLNSESRQCMDVSKHDGHGKIKSYPCEDDNDQMWETYCQETVNYCYFRNKQDLNYCLDARNPGNQAHSNPCNWEVSQQIRFIDNDWEPTQADWLQRACNTSGGLTYTVTTEIDYTQSVTKSVTTTVSDTMREGIFFASEKMTTEISTTLSHMFEASASASSSTQFTCDYN